MLIKKLVLLVLIGLSADYCNASAAPIKTSPLMDAAKVADLAKMQLLLTKGANPAAVAGRNYPRAGKPVLRYAIDSHSPEAVQLLLKHGAQPNEITESPIIDDHAILTRNLTLLGHAVNSFAPLSVIQALIHDHNTAVDAAVGGWTPLMVAAFRGYLGAAQALLAAQANPNLRNWQNKTALDYAIEQGHTYLIKLLSTYKS